MKKLLRLLLATAICATVTPAFAQNKKKTSAQKPIAAKGSAEIPVAPQKTFVLKGKAANFKDDKWEFAYTALIKNEIAEVPVKADGTFTKTMPIKDAMDLYLYLNDDAITIFVQAGDTLNIDWDNKDLQKTFKITANRPWRQKELDLMMKIYNGHRQPMLQIQRDLYAANISDSVKYNRIKDNFMAEMKLLTDAPVTDNSRKIMYDIYFQHAALFRRMNRFKTVNYTLPLNAAIPEGSGLRGMLGKELFDPSSWGYIEKLLDERLFLASSEYRDFIAAKIGDDDSAFSAVSYEGGPRKDNVPNYTLNKCYAAVGKLSLSPLVRDWYVTKTIIEGFEYYNYSDVEDAYKKLSPDIEEPQFKKALTDYYASIQSLKPGTPAPVFKLKDVDGKMVSLSDFRGKVVYIDFWGVYCGPCIGDIKTYGAQFHQKYKEKGVVFLNICVDANEKEWKKSIADLKLEGINLFANSITDPACKAYHINGIPHYIIVGADGKIVNNNAPRMGELMGNGVTIKRNSKGDHELDMAIANAQ